MDINEHIQLLEPWELEALVEDLEASLQADLEREEQELRDGVAKGLDAGDSIEVEALIAVLRTFTPEGGQVVIMHEDTMRDVIKALLNTGTKALAWDFEVALSPLAPYGTVYQVARSDFDKAAAGL